MDPPMSSWGLGQGSTGVRQEPDSNMASTLNRNTNYEGTVNPADGPLPYLLSGFGSHVCGCSLGMGLLEKTGIWSPLAALGPFLSASVSWSSSTPPLCLYLCLCLSLSTFVSLTHSLSLLTLTHPPFREERRLLQSGSY